MSRYEGNLAVERVYWQALDEIAFCAKPEQAKDIADAALVQAARLRKQLEAQADAKD